MRHGNTNANRSHYTVTVFAGVDMYTQVRVPVHLQANLEGEYDFIIQNLHDRMHDDFGEGAELVRRVPGTYDIDVSKVPIS